MEDRVGARDENGVRGGLRGGFLAVGLLLLGTLGISAAFGMLLLLPLYVQELGGDEADFGLVLSAAAVPAGPCARVFFPPPRGPVIARLLVETPLGFRGTFLVAGVVCLVAVVLTLVVGAITPDARTSAGKEDTRGNESSAVPFGAAIGRILGSEAVFPLAMILLFACLFTSMTSFQPTFAGARGLDYSV